MDDFVLFSCIVFGSVIIVVGVLQRFIVPKSRNINGLHSSGVHSFLLAFSHLQLQLYIKIVSNIFHKINNFSSI